MANRQMSPIVKSLPFRVHARICRYSVQVHTRTRSMPQASNHMPPADATRYLVAHGLVGDVPTKRPARRLLPRRRGVARASCPEPKRVARMGMLTHTYDKQERDRFVRAWVCYCGMYGQGRGTTRAAARAGPGPAVWWTHGPSVHVLAGL